MGRTVKRGKTRTRDAYNPRKRSFRIRVNDSELEEINKLSKDLGMSKCLMVFTALDLLREQHNKERGNDID